MYHQLKTILPPSARRRLRRMYHRIRYRGRQQYCPVCASFVSTFLPGGIVPRPHARCPICGALERHRLVTVFFKQWTELFTGRPTRLLHIAPEAMVEQLLRTTPQLTYISADLLRADVMLRLDLTAIGCADNTMDVVYCSHVLEHVRDDRQAMCELRRILKPEGWMVLQVPITASTTLEDPTITDPHVRQRVFGQADHVRRYGADFTSRLEEVGLLVLEIPAEVVVGGADMRVLGINHTEHVFFCVKERNTMFKRVHDRLLP